MNNKKGFSLVELIIVIAILGIIGVVGVMSFTAVQKNSKINTDLVTADKIGESVRMWYTDNQSQANKTTLESIVLYKNLTGITNYISIGYKPNSFEGEFYVGMTSDEKIKIIIAQESTKGTTSTYNGTEAGIAYIEK